MVVRSSLAVDYWGAVWSENLDYIPYTKKEDSVRALPSIALYNTGLALALVPTRLKRPSVSKVSRMWTGKAEITVQGTPRQATPEYD